MKLLRQFFTDKLKKIKGLSDSQKLRTTGNQKIAKQTNGNGNDFLKHITHEKLRTVIFANRGDRLRKIANYARTGIAIRRRQSSGIGESVESLCE
jgi:hypothetical protein